MRRGLQLALLAVVLVLAFPGSAAAFGPLSSFGSFGSGAGELDAPAQLAVAANGDVYVADRGNGRISVFAGNGAFLGTFGEGIVEEPWDVALDDSGRVFAADTLNNRISVFSAMGSFLFAFGKGVGGAGIDVCETSCQQGAAESAAGAITNPHGVFVDGSRVYVANSEFSRIDVFSTAGVFLFGFGKEVNASDDSDVCDVADGCKDGAHSGLGAMFTPLDVIVGGDGNVYVADYGNERVDNFTQQGVFLRTIGETGPGALAGPVSLAWDDPTEFYVADEIRERVERFSVGGFSLGGFTAEPNVAGVAVACGGNVFAVEWGALFARIERFGEPGTPPPPCAAPPAGQPVQVSLVPLPSNRIRFAGLVKNRRNGSAVLFVRVPGPGRVILKGRGVRRLARSARRATRVRLPVKPKVRLRHFVKRHGKGRIRVEATFRPVGGEPRSIEKVIVLRRKR